MKKIITLFAITFLLSCSKDDGTLDTTYQNFAGQWKYKSIVKADGTVIPYTGLCPSKEDYLEIFTYRKIITYNYYPDCVSDQDWGCTDFGLDSNGLIYVGGAIFDNATVTNLTKSGFRIEYPVPTDLTFMIDNVHDAKAIIFVKK